MTDLILSPEVKTMSSLEVSQMLSKRHDKVKQSIERLVNKGVIHQPPMGDGGKSLNNSRVLTYLLDKRSSLIVVAQLSPEFTAAVVDRWQELEGKQQILPTTYLGALKELVAKEEQLQIALATKAEIGNRREATAMNTASQKSKENKRLVKALERHDCKTVTELLEDTGISARNANMELETLGYLYTENVNGKNRKRLTELGETVAKEFKSKKFVQIGIIPSCEDKVLDMILGG